MCAGRGGLSEIWGTGELQLETERLSRDRQAEADRLSDKGLNPEQRCEALSFLRRF